MSQPSESQPDPIGMKRRPDSGDVQFPFSTAEQRLGRMIQDFNDPSPEWRRLFAGLLGTFFLVLVAAGGPMIGTAIPGSVGRAAAVVAPG
jgi:hypothetical protein